MAKTRLELEAVAAGKMPAIERISFKVAGFDRRSITARLKELKVDVVPSEDKDAVRFKDLNGLTMDLKAGG